MVRMARENDLQLKYKRTVDSHHKRSVLCRKLVDLSPKPADRQSTTTVTITHFALNLAYYKSLLTAPQNE